MMTDNERPRGGAAQHMVERLRELALQRPADAALIVVSRGGETRLDYAQLDLRARALAAVLQQGFEPGERALLLLDNDEHYVAAFSACLYAGLIAVPVFPPESQREQHLARLAAIAKDCGAACVLTTSVLNDVVAGRADIFGGVRVVEVDRVKVAHAETWREREPRLSDIAFLQYTSGSTAAPKGVMVSHANLMANERAIEQCLAVREDDVFVSWLPLYHDMGLIGGLLQPLHRGIPCVLMSPSFFLERPLRWLEAISRHRGTISGGPDFAYRLCVDRIKPSQLAELDLSSWRVAFSGAEPVRHETLRAFIERFGPARFAADAVYPCYGLAEATLFVSGGQRGAGLIARPFSTSGLSEGQAGRANGEGMTLVDCGRSAAQHEVVIVDTHTQHALPEGRVGEIWARGPSIAQGYWQRHEESAATFVERDGHRWLRTGDLGFLHEGGLYINGRLKDLIILRGQNVYPQDLERAIEAEVEAVRRGRAAAFAVNLSEGGEGVGVAVEVSRGLQKLVPPQALVEALSQAVSGVCREPVSVAVLLNPGGLPRTSSGKLQRAACREGWRARSLDAYAIWEHGRLVQDDGDAGSGVSLLDETEAELATLWREVLKRELPLSPKSQFFASGGNSLAAIQLAAGIAERWQIEFPARDVFREPALGAMAREIRRLQAAGSQRRPVIPVLAAERRTGPLPLSHAQQRQWFLWKLDPSSAAHHVSGAVWLRGSLKPEFISHALDRLVARHESLRTLFRMNAEGLPEQQVLPEASVALQLVDLCALPTPERVRRADEEAKRLQSQPFDLTKAPLLRAALIRTGDEEHLLVLVMHHIVSDGSSLLRLVDEFGLLLLAQANGHTAALQPLPIQYADYATWQRDAMDAAEVDMQIAWWREQLGGEQPVLALTPDHARGTHTPHPARSHAVELPHALLNSLQAVAAGQGATLFMLLLTAFQALLHRHTGQGDIPVGVPVANRHRPETEGVIGLFVDTQVLRNRIDARLPLSSLFTQTRDAVLSAQAHADVPFERLVEALQPDRSISATPLFQVLFNLVDEDFGALARLPGVDVKAHTLPPAGAPFELALDIKRRADGSGEALFTWAAELFDPLTMQRLAGHYLRLLQQWLAKPEQTLADVDLLGDDEREQLLQWSYGDDRYASAPPVHVQIEQQARERPQATALIFGDTQTTYAEFNAQANRLAHRLLRYGANAETCIAVALERSAEMVVALLAVLKSGAAYVPLDPDYPADRLAWMLQDSGSTLLLTQGSLRPRLSWAAGVQVLEIDQADLADEPARDPAVPLHPQQLAYLIYTSGSTGRPKGVAVAHGPLAMHVRAIGEAYGMRPDDRELQFASISFDGAHERTWVPLAFGAALMPRGKELWTAQRSSDEMRRHRITMTCFTPGYLHQYAELLGVEGRVRSLRSITVGGEAMSRASFELVQQALAPPRIINGYGPTETVITPTIAKAGPGTRFESASMPIGRLVGDRRAYVLDAELNLLPQGAAGELYLGGFGLARGYLNRADLSAERFVADPFDAQGGRMYRTGDLVRCRADGELEYLGRMDQQVKVRGFRIELGELESELLRLPGVREAAAQVRPAPGGGRLVGYVSPMPGVDLDVAALREGLAQRLPDYMLPGAIVVLPSLPRNPAGKVDRQALPDSSHAGTSEEAAPRDEVEHGLAALWAELLALPRVGLHDNFFELGGHSLLLMKLQHRLAQRFSRAVEIVDLFRHPTVASLAGHLQAGGAVASQAPSQERAQRQRAALLQRRTPSAERTPT